MTEFGLEEMRSCMLEALRQSLGRDGALQNTGLRRGVAQVAIARELLQDPRTTSLGTSYTVMGSSATDLPASLWAYYRDVLWALIVEGVIAIGSNSNNEQWPWLGVTEYGKACLKAGEILPHDPEGYLRTLATARPLDPTEQRFVGQALEAFLRNLPDASAVMLGCASEHLLLVLANSLAAKDPTQPSVWAKRANDKALTLLKHLDQDMEQRGADKKLSPALKEQRATTFAGIAQIIRIARNDAGHPALQHPVTRDECFVNLRLFHHYRTWIAQVISGL